MGTGIPENELSQSLAVAESKTRRRLDRLYDYHIAPISDPSLTFFTKRKEYGINKVCHKTLQMTTTTNEYGQNNMWAKEPRMYISKEDAAKYGLETYAEKAEKLNGRWAMIGFIAMIASYGLTGNLFFGVV